MFRPIALVLFAIALLAVPLHGADAPASQPGDQAGVQRFYGSVTAVDTKASTFIVDGQTYHVVAETHMTKATDDKPATLADAVVGEPARGSFTKAADGTMNVTKVRFGKKSGGGGKSGGGKSGGKKKDQAASQPTTQG